MMDKKGIILLSGGLDSLISLDIAKKQCNIELALTFNYGQKAFKDEKEASEQIAKFYNIKHEIIELPFLKNITTNALTDPNDNNFNTLESVWIPNRNGLFLNIAACYCDKFGYDYIIFGANLEEGRAFSDNTKEYIEIADKFFKYSTAKHPLVLAPCVGFDKVQIINYAIDNAVNLNLIKSCYKDSNNSKKHCGECMSCKHLYKAILNSKKPELIKEIF